jgi:hypothetical protein
VVINQISQWQSTVEESRDSSLAQTQSLGQVHPPVAAREGILDSYPNPLLEDWMGKGGDAVVFVDAAAARLSVAEVDAYRAYYPWTQPGGYSRLLVHNTYDKEHPYTLDIFRVVGGVHHEYMLHGSTLMNMRTSSSGNATTLPGDHPLLAPSLAWETPPYTWGFSINDRRWYGQYRNAASSDLTQNSSVDFVGQCDGDESPRCNSGDPAPSLRLWEASSDLEVGNGTAAAELYTAEAPHDYRASRPVGFCHASGV